mmetsp:Transcript_70819/g.82497  ORF Transcript_70819/g.82497 Transcript_70819/m.82497 type:complete len:133 (+) Transcript_70819:53-451(+)
MLQRTVKRLAGGSIHDLYPHGIPKRTFPLREHNKQISFAPQAGGFYVTKYAVGWPFQLPLEFLWYRSALSITIGMILYDLIFGLPLPMMKEAPPGAAHHHFFNNTGGTPHHFWQYQDGWTVPNQSGARRWFD